MRDALTAYGRTPSKADFEPAIINVNIWRVPPSSFARPPRSLK